MDSKIFQLEKYEKERLHAIKNDMVIVPVKYHAIIKSTIRYKFLRDEMCNLLGTVLDNMVPGLVKPMQRLSDALLNFSVAYGENLGVYYTMYGVLSGMSKQLVSSRDIKTADSIMDIVRNAVGCAKDMSKASDELKNALAGLNNAIIELAGSQATKKLEEDMNDAYDRARVHSMEAETLRRDLSMDKATLRQLEDTSCTDEMIQQNLKDRIQKELSSAQDQQSKLKDLVNNDGKTTTTTHTGYYPYYGWRWWYYSGSYSYTTTHTTDTKSEQNKVKGAMEDIDKRVDSLKKRLEEQSLTRNKKLEQVKASIIDKENKLKVLDERSASELKTAQSIEAKLQEQRLIAAGCDRETSAKLQGAFKITLPLFLSLADNTSRLSTIYTSMKAVITASSNMPAIAALSIFDEVSKLALAGDYVSNDCLSICHTDDFSNGVNVSIAQYNRALEAVKAAPSLEYNKVEAIKSLDPNSKKDDEMLQALPALSSDDL